MRRKIVKQGVDTYTLSLPIKWARQHNLNPGDEVEISEKEDTLVISSQQFEKKTKIIKMDTNEDTSRLRSVIASAYKSGYSDIILEFHEFKDVSDINEIVNSFTGLELISQKNKMIVLSSFLQIDRSQVNNLIIKMFLMIKEIIKQSDKQGINSLESLRHSLRKVRDHVLRSIQSLHYGGDLAFDYYDLVTQLEKIGADFCFLADNLRAKKISKQEAPFLLKDLSEKMDKTYLLYLKKDFTEINLFWIKIKQELHNRDVKSFTKKYGVIGSIHYSLLLERIFHVTSRLLSLSS
ncbi:AbrB/MazE/SpoVT family DNA-binding domain-containing protein [Candidatus Woesearchaeota archaeon]|nr:AbrB/MazE/SpoVT family DNA-binding domain-containing protein [Candidatus Woesearchaeota archaeon]